MGPYIFLDLYELLFICLNSKENHRLSPDVTLQGATSRLEERDLYNTRERDKEEKLNSVHAMYKEKTETIVAAFSQQKKSGEESQTEPYCIMVNHCG